MCAQSSLSNLCAQIAQLVEQRTENPRVLGSIPSLGTFLCKITDLSYALAKFRNV